ncbi:MAG: hypothetical protein IAF58_15335 [Leptolyngbya sp.]|nr:hypothetical protein [Candidatus Melainabacteria bacterium]
MNKFGDSSKRTGRNFFRVSAFAAFSLSLFLSVPASFAVAPNDSNLLKLEDKFFHKSYPKETMDERLDRVEKMVFGEAKEGAEDARLASLVQAVPTLNQVDQEAAPPQQTANRGNGSGNSGGKPAAAADEEDDSTPAPIGHYPSIDAMEKKVLGKPFSQEPVNQRLARLETKLFGKASTSTDLTDRTDKLKLASGVDITKSAPLNTDWADEEDEEPTNITPPSPVARQGADGRSFSGRDIGADMRKAFGMPGQRSTMGGSGSYGGGGMSSGGGMASSGSYGSGSGIYGAGSAPAPRPRPAAPSPDFDDDEDDDLPPPTRRAGVPQAAPDIRSAARPQGMGLNQQVTLMENEVFSKTFPKDALPARLQRLETSLFPAEKPWIDKALPERVQRLAGVIAISPSGSSQKVAQTPQPAPSYNDDDGYPPTAPTASRRGNRGGGGLGKILNSIGSMMGGGFVGGYPMQGGTVVTDPRTGLLLDTRTGNLIDPATGMVIGQRSVQGFSTGFGGMNSGMGGMGSFGNGFSTGGFGMSTGGMRFGSPMGGGYGMGRWP